MKEATGAGREDAPLRDFPLLARITLESLDLSATIRAHSLEDAKAAFAERIASGEFNEEIDRRAVGRAYDKGDIWQED